MNENINLKIEFYLKEIHESGLKGLDIVKEYQNNKNWNEIKNLILFIMKDEYGLILEKTNARLVILSDKGRNIYKLGWFNHLELLKQEEQKQYEIKNLEFEKSKVDFKLAKKMLKEYPKTKWFSRIGFIIAIVLALKELYIWLMQLQSQ